MNIKVVEGKKEHINDCIEALIKSDLGEKYFTDEEKAYNGVYEFVEAGTLLVALDKDNTCVGFMGYIPKGAFHSFPYLHIIAIKEEYRNKGIGKKMMNHFEEMMFINSSKIFLVVADFNPKAKLFYEKLGYKEVGAIPDLYREGITEYFMMKKNG